MKVFFVFYTWCFYMIIFLVGFGDFVLCLRGERLFLFRFYVVFNFYCGFYYLLRLLIWFVFVFLFLDVDSGYYIVKFDLLLLKEVVVEGDSILFLLRIEFVGFFDLDSSDLDDFSYVRGMVAV